MNKRRIDFYQQVETTYSPAVDFGEVIAADKIKDLTERVVLMTSDVLTVTEFLQPPPRWIEVEATGNTKVRGEKFDVDAPKVAYTSQKETIKMEGDGRASAKAWVHETPGADPNTLVAERFTYDLRTGGWQTDGAKIRILLPPDMKPKGPAIPGLAPVTNPTNPSRRFP